MLTNTLLLYVTQEAWAKARERLIAARHASRRDDVTAPPWLEEAEHRQTSERDGGQNWPPRIRH